MKTVYDFVVKDRKGGEVSLREYANEVILIVNTATKCGFTPQYEELEAIYEKYHAKCFTILDFPCNQFGQQAPGTDESIHEVCKLNFGTEFPRFKKIKVNGEDADPYSKRCSLRKIPTIRKRLALNGTSPSSSLTSRGLWWLVSNPPKVLKT